MTERIEYLNVPVPSEHVPAVYRLLAALDSGATDVISELEAETPEPGDAWNDELLSRLLQSDKKAVAILCKVLNALAKAPGEWFSTADLEGPTGETQHQLRYIWSSLTRHFDSKYGTRTWPVNYQWGTNFDPEREPRMYYSVSTERAEQWKQLAGL